jgi:hypothetical protein
VGVLSIKSQVFTADVSVEKVLFIFFSAVGIRQ